MQHPCRLFNLLAEKPERFTAVAFLADRIHALRAGRSIVTKPGKIDLPEFSGAGVAIFYEDDGDILGAVIIGDPDYAAERQDQLLHGALYRLDPARGDPIDWVA